MKNERVAACLAAASLALAALGLSAPASGQDWTVTTPDQVPSIALRGSTDGHGFHVDVFAQEGPPPAPPRAARALAPLADTFGLHSRPSASRTIYLDFDGYDLSATSAWTGQGFDAGRYDGFSLDGDHASFSSAERTEIQQVWTRVAEDYAPFDLDVTTEEPRLKRLRRLGTGDLEYGVVAAVVDAQDARQVSSSGIAWVDVFDETPDSTVWSPAWIFTSEFSTDPSVVADIVSHEIGHTVSLRHDSGNDGEYHWGQGIWSPIMGQGDRALTQWSKGEYAGAYNNGGDLHQDDVALIGADKRGQQRLDDHSDTTVGATWLGAGTALGGQGVVSARGDQDVFTLDRGACGTTMNVSVTPTSDGPNLDVQLRVLDSNGIEIAKVNPPSGATNQGGISVATGLGASASIPAASAGTYFVEVDGLGQGDPAGEGYSDYDSLGSYTVTANGCAGDTGAPTQPQNLRATPLSASQATVAWDAPASAGGSPVTGYTVRLDGTNLGPTANTSYDLTGMAKGPHTVTVSATAGSAGQVARLDFRTHPGEIPADATAPGVPRQVTAFDGISDIPGKDIIVAWKEPKSDGGMPVDRYRLLFQKMVNGNVAGTVKILDPGSMLSQYKVGKGHWRVKIQAHNFLRYGKYSSFSRTVTAR